MAILHHLTIYTYMIIYTYIYDYDYIHSYIIYVYIQLNIIILYHIMCGLMEVSAIEKLGKIKWDMGTVGTALGGPPRKKSWLIIMFPS